LEPASDPVLPKNIQGKVACALARGLELEAILKLQKDNTTSQSLPISWHFLVGQFNKNLIASLPPINDAQC